VIGEVADCAGCVQHPGPSTTSSQQLCNAVLPATCGGWWTGFAVPAASFSDSLGLAMHPESGLKPILGTVTAIGGNLSSFFKKTNGFGRGHGYLSSNPVRHQRIKHTQIDLHFVSVRDKVSLGGSIACSICVTIYRHIH